MSGLLIKQLEPEYSRIPDWWLWEPEQPRRQGWKLHLGYPGQGKEQQLYDQVVQMLYYKRIVHKVVQFTSKIVQDPKDTQYGKWLVIYPNSPIQSLAIAYILGSRLGVFYMDNFAGPPNDIEVVKGFIYSRYGLYEGLKLLDDKNNPVSDSREIAHPSWVENIWTKYFNQNAPFNNEYIWEAYTNPSLKLKGHEHLRTLYPAAEEKQVMVQQNLYPKTKSKLVRN